MSKYCVIVADGARARLFALEEAGLSGIEGVPNLVELSDLTNPEFEASGAEVWTDISSGRNQSSGGGGAHGYDDHRQRHMAESERRFAKKVVAAATQELERRHADHLVVAAEKQMLGHLREVLSQPMRGGVQVREVAKDLTKLTARDVQAHLAAESALPARKTPVAS